MHDTLGCDGIWAVDGCGQKMPKVATTRGHAETLISLSNFKKTSDNKEPVAPLIVFVFDFAKRGKSPSAGN